MQAEAKQEEAEPLLRELLLAKRRLLGPRHPDSLTGLNQLALLVQACALARP